MTYHLGIDLGTVYTAAAVHRDGRTSVVTLGDRAASIPSAIFLKEDETILTGDAASRRAVSEPDKDGLAALTFTIAEGDVFRVGTVILGKLAAGDEKALLAKMKTKPKQVFSRSRLGEDVKALTETFAERGQKVEILPRTDVDAKTKTLAITLDVEAAGQ